MRRFLLTGLMGLALQANAANLEGDYLVKLQKDTKAEQVRLLATLPEGTQMENFGLPGWVRVKLPQTALQSVNAVSLASMKNVSYVEQNQVVKILDNPSLVDVQNKLAQMGVNLQDECPIPGACGGDNTAAQQDNPEIPAPVTPSQGTDPLFSHQWGMADIGAQDAWNINKGSNKVVVAVIDTGVNYTHEDLVENLWRNPGEYGTDAQGRSKATNGVDDDGNGYIDDVIGWDFVSNDNKPFDLSVSMLELLNGGNPGHGTHCAGNVAARGFNGKGISGVAPNVSIMSIRFLGEKGQGTIDGAVKSVLYAINNGAQIMSNSWGSEGEDEGDAESKALKEAIALAQQKGVLFVAAAGNGHNGVGYDNDTDARPGFPASYPDDIIVSVAALDAQGELGAFSNWGAKSVDLGAPGVKVYSTTSDGKYNDTVINLEFLGIVATWDGTSMATPHVAGAAALYLSQHPNANWKEIKDALLKSVRPIPSMSGKSTSGGKLNVQSLMTL